ncbi:hypothetical protein JY651_44405 [Pyxidicoccus parkwayensis]|uniref:Lipoprotein n=1 Tax=Pyxidicoccus parkwayensis TaxID=2813578 RepID=A0ABX7NT88_9BACT|nr:hypothetical protein [Pyxidicoccus parkwaysis]QSQ22109.1 hypothetical protein JY651_44405 [Pyxidicoccus parkwaysis]
MRKVLFLGAFALGAVACDPDIAKDAPPAEEAVVAEFDPAASPPVVPSPNDLAMKDGLVNAPINPSAPEAEQEFTRDYVNTLDGFPTSISASTTVKNLDPASVTAATVKILDLYEGTPLSRPVPSNVVIGYNPDTDKVNVIAPTGWPKGGRYGVVLVGGDKGLKTTSGKNVIASATWAFASSNEPLVTCEDLTAPNCRAATELIPATATDPAERIAQQTATALQLEQLRRGYKPVIDAAADKFQIKRDDIVLAWTFTVMNMPEATFDPGNSIIPFPNDLLRVPAQGNTPAHLNLPVNTSPNANPLEVAISQGLNTLDGWSTTAPIVSENGAKTGVIDVGAELDMNTVQLGKSLLFIKATNTDKGTAPKVKVCLNCASSLKADGSAQTTPQQLQIIPEVPLDEATQYAVVMLRGMKDIKGRAVAPTAAQALLRSKAALVDGNGKSQVSAVPDFLAAQLEPARLGMKPLYDALEALGIKRKDVNLAWAFTTQSTLSILQKLNAVPTAVPADPLYLVDQTSNLTGTMALNKLDNESVGSAFAGAFASPYLLSDTQGTLNRAEPRIDHVPFLLFLPKSDVAPMPANGYPVVIFGHGLTGNRTNIVAVANTFNKNGFAVVAIDSVLHGDRTSCAGIAPPGITAGSVTIDEPNEACSTGTCDVTPNSPSFGRCVAPATAIACDPSPTAAVAGDLVCASQRQGRCLSTGKCEGGDFLRGSSNNANAAPVVSGWNFLNLTNLFATRDNFRHSVIDVAQVSRMVATATLNARINAAKAGAGSVDGTQVHYVGQSLGGLQGGLIGAVNTKLQHVGLNAAGGGLTDVLLTATNPTFVAYRGGFNALLTSAGRPPGTPAYDEFITLARTILDPADPRNFGYFLENGQAANREVFVQYIKGDDVIPNPVTDFLLGAANRGTQRSVQSYMFDVQPLPANVKHGFFTIFDPTADASTAAFLKSVRDQAQGQMAAFLQTGLAPTP